MKFTETPLQGAYVIEMEPRGDDRGWFARFFCQREFEAQQLNCNIVQINNSFSKYRGTLRGMHYQLPPRSEDKVFRCLRGSFLDVIVDLRPGSATFLKHFKIQLTAENRKMLYIPKGFANGLMSLTDDTEALYWVTEYFSPQHERGLRYNDPKLGIEWPFEPTVVSPKDSSHPDFNPEMHLK